MGRWCVNTPALPPKGLASMDPQSTSQTCSVSNCHNPIYARGYCSVHYWRWWRHGDPTVMLSNLGKSLEQRFWEKVIRREDDACWGWTAAKANGGYGVLGNGNRLVRAHRLSYELHVGPIPAGMEVCHRCDNPECTNPQHLFLGTHADNVQDMLQKRRDWAGGRKLTREQVRDVYQRIHAGESAYHLADEFGVSRKTIQRIGRRETYRNVEVD